MPKGIYKRTQEYRNGISGTGNHFYGRKHINETKLKISIANKGRKQSEAEKQKRREAHLGKKYKPMSKEGRDNIRKAHLGLTYPTASVVKKGIHYSPSTEFKKGLEPWIKGRHHTKESNQKNGRAHIGLMAKEKHWNWKGGISSEELKIRKSSKYNSWRNKVLKRDKETCQICGSEINIIAHHIKNFSDNLNLRFNINNGIALCRSCHVRLHINWGPKK